MKQIKSYKTAKIAFVFCTIFAILASMVIFPSAQTDDSVIESGFYVFNDEVTFEYLNDYHEEYFNFSSGGLDCDTFYVLNSGFIEYWDIDGYTHAAYENRWLSSDYRVIYLPEDATDLSPEFVKWYDANTNSFSLDEISGKKGMYKDIEQILTLTIYDAEFDQLDSFQRMTITLLSTVACVAVVALPLIVVFWLVKWLFSLFKYF